MSQRDYPNDRKVTPSVIVHAVPVPFLGFILFPVTAPCTAAPFGFSIFATVRWCDGAVRSFQFEFFLPLWIQMRAVEKPSIKENNFKY